MLRAPLASSAGNNAVLTSEDFAAQKVTLVNDIDGTPRDSDGGTVRFSIDGANYKIDLSADNTSKLHKVLGKYVSNARKARSGSSPAPSSGVSRKCDPDHLKAIREWAAENGHQVSSRGRIPPEILDAFEAAN
ncbi:Lsr2 family protein [Rathayibacter sp. AY1A7]|uniref:histone-like nucleoid-structuring protein Lsr2 n=1 Tax=Rathayibacter sp. AY1A7 TaxID=2080524 RepID=UPI000CE8545C|nr:Lsr2 family protein [Rathayibacter sp. AY1A7]PPF20896.1 hypothetical protein C5B95_07190 [Rathayibacter sp. AY1A7]